MSVNRKVLTLCLIVSEGRVNLGLKKRGFGAGRFNGYGGKVESGETIQEAAIREVREECGVEVKELEQRGKVDKNFTGRFLFGDNDVILKHELNLQ